MVKDIINKCSVAQRLRALILPRIEIRPNILPGITIDLCPIGMELSNLIKQYKSILHSFIISYRDKNDEGITDNSLFICCYI